MQCLEDRIVQDRRGHELAQVLELDARAIEESIHILVGSGQNLAVDVQRLTGMGGRAHDEQASSHGQSSRKEFDRHIGTFFGF